MLKNPRQQRFFKINDLVELFTLGDDVKNKSEGEGTSDRFRNQSVAFFKGVGVDNSIIASLNFTQENRFNTLFTNTKIPELEPSSDDTSDVEPGEEKGESEEDREFRLRALSRKLSQQLAAENSSKKRRHRTKRKHGMRIDGHRIRLVDRSSDYDEGDDDLEEESSSSKHRKLSEQRDAFDPFVASVLYRYRFLYILLCRRNMFDTHLAICNYNPLTKY